MPAFVLLPATPNDLEQVVRLQFDACASDPGFTVIFPNGPTPSSIQHFVQQYENDMDHDPTCHLMIVRDAMTGDIASFAIWHFYPARSTEDVEKEMLSDDIPLPADANRGAGRKMIHDGIRKRHEVVAVHIGMGRPYAYIAGVGTSPKYQKQGAASLLIQWGTERADDLGMPAYVESTPAGERLYQKHGFHEVDRLRLEVAPWKEGEFYNGCMVRLPAES